MSGGKIPDSLQGDPLIQFLTNPAESRNISFLIKAKKAGIISVSSF